MTTVLRARGLSMAYPGRNAFVLRNIDLDVAAGRVVGLVGPNGAGKSTLVRLLAGILRPDAGTVELLGRPLAEMSHREVARVLGYVPQDIPADVAFSAHEVVLTGRHSHLGLFSLESEHDAAICQRAMEAMRVDHLASRRLTSLSGGERQRVYIARALASEPKVLLADEPAAHLDLGFRTDLGRRLRSLADEQSLAVVIVHHDLNLAASSCDEIVLLAGGEVLAAGTTERVLTAERIEAAYGWPVAVDTNPHTGRPWITALTEPLTS